MIAKYTKMTKASTQTDDDRQSRNRLGGEGVVMQRESRGQSPELEKLMNGSQSNLIQFGSRGGGRREWNQRTPDRTRQDRNRNRNRSNQTRLELELARVKHHLKRDEEQLKKGPQVSKELGSSLRSTVSVRLVA